MSAPDVAPSASDGLQVLHQRLLARYKDELRASRGAGPVHLIELEMTADAIEACALALREALDERPLREANRPYWHQRYLPLLRVATEVGYLYQGAGTEYWPVLEQRLGVEIRPQDYRELRHLFDAFSASCALTIPDTPWARHFHNIARPITHAILPRELHAPLLEALLAADARRLGTDSWEVIGGALRAQAELMAQRSRPGRRLGHFLEQGRVAEAVVRALAFGETRSDHVAAHALRRIRADVLRVDRSAALLKQVVERARPAPSPPPVTPPRRAPAGDAGKICPLLLVIDGDRLSLEVQIPASGHGLEHAARRRVRLLGQGRAVSVDRLVLGGREPLLDVDLSGLPAGPHPLLRPEDAAAIALEAPLRRHLTGLQLDLSAPLLLAEHLGPSFTARQLRERVFTPRDGYWLLSAVEPEDRPHGAALHEDRPAGLYAVRVDAQEPSVRRWLERLGLQAVIQPRVRWLGSPPVGGRGDWGSGLVAGDLLLLQVEREEVEVAGAGAPLAPGLWRCALPAPPRSWEARLGGGLRIEVPVRAVAAAPPPAVEVALEGASPTLQALSQRRLFARISGGLPLAGLRARLLLEDPHQVIVETETAPLQPLPAVIPSDDPCWGVLAGALEERALFGISLRIEVGAMASASWPLPAPETDLWWRGDQLVGDADEDEATRQRQVWSAERPLSALEGGEAPADGFSLIVPIDEARQPLPGLARVEGPRRLVLGGLRVAAPDRLLRRARAGAHDPEGAVGAASLVEALLRWSEARGAHVAAEAARRIVVLALDEQVTEALCGPAWTARERTFDRAAQEAGRHLARALMARGLAVDELARDHLAAQLPGGEAEARIERALVAALRPHEPWLRSLGSAPAVNDALTRPIEQILGVTYQEAARGLEPYPPEASPDFSLDPEVLAEALRDAHEQWARAMARPELLALVHPSDAAHEGLGGLDYAGLSLEELAAELSLWLKRRAARSRTWTEDEVGALLRIWIPMDEPPQALAEPLDGALADRFAARAVRYGALRWRAARGLGGR